MTLPSKRPYGTDTPRELTMPGGRVIPGRSNTPIQTLEMLMDFSEADEFGPALAPAHIWRASPRTHETDPPR